MHPVSASGERPRGAQENPIERGVSKRYAPFCNITTHLSKKKELKHAEATS